MEKLQLPLEVCCNYSVMGGGSRKPTYEQLLEENRRLREQNQQLQGQVRALKAALGEAREQIEELRRASKRQAAPFRRRESNKKPAEGKGSPGRKPGHEGCCRPKPDQVDEHRHVPLEGCPCCGGPLRDVRPVEQFIEEIPPLRVRTIRVVTHSGWCPRCGKRVRSTAPEQVSTATGCAGVHLGRRALGLAAYFKYVLGLTYRKMSALMEVFGLKVSPGGLAQALQRTAVKMVGSWMEIWEEIRAGPVAHADETSWYVGEPGWWLWVFCRPGWTLYAADRSRGSDVVHRTLEGFEGTLVSDCLSSYDPPECKKQKCYAHHLRALSDSVELLPQHSAEPLEKLRSVLHGAMVLDDVRERVSGEQFAQMRDHLEQEADRILGATYSVPGVEKALARFRKQREHLFRFLYEPEVPPTNNLAERQLRPAVIARKLSCGNRTDWGRMTWQILASIAATCQQQGKSLIEHIASGMQLGAKPPKLSAA